MRVIFTTGLALAAIIALGMGVEDASANEQPIPNEEWDSNSAEDS
jgi:hypothetical protein